MPYSYADAIGSCRSNIGGIVVAVMMQQLNQRHPDDYLLAMRILWAPIGLMIIFWAFIPESPWFHARRGDKEKAMKSLKQLFGNVEGYDFEEELGIIERTIEHERTMLDHAPRYRDVFKGLNLVCHLCFFLWLYLTEYMYSGCKLRLTWAETHIDSHDPRCLPAVRRIDHHQHLLYL
jgi:hypothetical protein